jgi:hypothetical protein
VLEFSAKTIERIPAITETRKKVYLNCTMFKKHLERLPFFVTNAILIVLNAFLRACSSQMFQRGKVELN